MTKINLLLLLILFAFTPPMMGQRQMESLDHGLVAVKSSSGVYVGWRVLASEWGSTEYKLYRDGALIYSSGLNGTSNFIDDGGSLSSTYELKTVTNAEEKTLNETTNVWDTNYIDIPVIKVDGGYSTYELNDASVGDLDGDGQYEIVVKRLAKNSDPASTDYHYLEAYELDGTNLWSVNMGPNINNKVEFNFLVWDLDGDGKAEVTLRTSEGFIDGEGNQIGDVDGDGITNYRYSISWVDYRREGPDFLSVLDGKTGKEITRTNYIPRGNVDDWGKANDGGHRATKCMYTVAYLNGKTPSIVVSRGIYGKIAMQAWDYNNETLTERWYFNSDSTGNSDYAAQGFHNLTMGDVDNDGKDEVVYGSMVIDDNGQGLYSTRLGHGDAQHLADINPNRKGMEYFGCLEGAAGGNYRDAGTGEILFYKNIGRDMGRAGCSDITPDYPGMEMWGPTGFPFLSATGKEITDLPAPTSMNFFIWWDGDVTREILDHDWHSTYGVGRISKYNNGNNDVLLSATGTLSNNSTKGTPSLSADIFGDWREEVIWRTSNDSVLRIYTTTDITQKKIYTLMQDPQYRGAIGWQPNSYNQPPHPGFFIGSDMDSVPPPDIMLKGQIVWNSGQWNKSAQSFTKDGEPVSYTDGDSVLLDISGDNSKTISITEQISPADIRVISPIDYTIRGSGAIYGQTGLTKSGSGTLTINNTNYYTGITRVWDGSLIVNGFIDSSDVYVKRFATLAGNGKIKKNVYLEKYANLIISSSMGEADTFKVKGNVTADANTNIYYDLSDDTTGATKTNDLLIIYGSLNLLDNTTISINLLDDSISHGSYLLAKIDGSLSGNLENCKLEGLSSYPAHLKYENHKLLLVIDSTRTAATVVWKGNESDKWDLFKTKNWLNNNEADFFIGKDSVVFNDEAVKTDIEIIENYTIGDFLYESSKDMSIAGEGSFMGESNLTKKGSGTLTLKTNNSYTGTTTINEGTLRISEPKNAIYASPIGIAGETDTNLIFNGGTLEVYNLGNMTTNRNIKIGENNGGFSISDANAALTLTTGVTGEGYLEKSGSGTLILNTTNTFTGAIVKEGTLKLGTDEANISGLGETVVLQGGTLAMYDNWNSYTNGCGWDIVVDEGQSGTLKLDARSSLTGTLTGGGELTLYCRWIRSELDGDWSNFGGSIHVTTDSDGGSLMISNNNGFKHSLINLDSKLYILYYISSDDTISIGALEGEKGSILGAGGQGSNIVTWKIGEKNTDAVFNGTITNTQIKGSGASAAIIKAGTGMWTLTDSSVYTGGTTIEEGTLRITNNGGSATGYGDVTCKNGAVLNGNGSTYGNVYIENKGTLSPGYNSIDTLTIGKDLELQAGSLLQMDLDTTGNDLVVCNGTVDISGILILEFEDGMFKAGDEFKIFSCDTIKGIFGGIESASLGAGLEWDTTSLSSNGTLRVVASETGSSISTVDVSNVTLYPNPVKQNMTLTFEGNLTNATVRIMDLTGQTVMVKNYYNVLDKLEVKTATLPVGYYIISVADKQNVIYTSSFVKISDK